MCSVCVCVCVCVVCVCVMCVCGVCGVCVCVCGVCMGFYLFIYLFHSMPHYTVILHALHNLRLINSHFKSESSIDLTNFTKKFW